MKTLSALGRATAFFLALSQVVLSAPAITRSIITTSPLHIRQEFSQCGINSEGGNKKCPLGGCCSTAGWCGTTNDHCRVDNCQADFGTCGMPETPKCTGKSAEARKVGYYLSYAIDRACDAVPPSKINTKGLTHLNFAFALFDAVNFEFYPEREGDDSIYTQFTALKTKKLQTWIAIGGGYFNNPDSSTKDNWAIMTRTSSNRAKWIRNLMAYMQRYGFQGVDLDWEWPGDETRGGTPADTANFVRLVSEMKAAFKGKYGISAAIVTDPWALQWTDVKGLEPNLDFINFMTYDYHWPQDSPAADATALSHTDIRETDQKLDLLWFAGISPAKVNLGLAYYGMTFTMTSGGCKGINCPYAGKGNAGPCINTPGLMTNSEVKRIIAKGGTSTKLISESMVKQTTWGGNQLALYDDNETIALKTKYASSKCLGGTMVWSIDQGIF